MKLFNESLGETENIIANAKKVKLDLLDYNKKYRLVKLTSKIDSPFGYPDAFEVTEGIPEIAGDDEYVWLRFPSGNNHYFGTFTYFKTSPIVNVNKLENGFKIETKNSFYKLEEVND